VENLYLSTTFVADQTSLIDALQLCKGNEISSVELGSNHPNEPDFEEIVRKFDFDYLVHNYFPIPRYSFVVNIASTDNTIYKRSLEHIKNAIDFCKDIGAKIYTIHPGFLTDPDGLSQNEGNYDFQWNDKEIHIENSQITFDRMLSAIKEIVEYARKKKITIAIETEGSVTHSRHLLMQRPEEYQDLFEYFSPGDLGINLNVGHLNLAATVFGFSRKEFVDLIADYVVAMELSHNNGVEDQHLPLVEEEWYWDTITDFRFSGVPKIMEFRNTPIEKVVDNMKLIRMCCHNQIKLNST
jgi:sugar phosphate isomerase/epimerase